MIIVGGGEMIIFPRVFPKMIMVGVVGVRENASWPRILLSLPQDDHGALSLRERSACMSHFRKDASESRAFSRGARGLRACLGEATSATTASALASRAATWVVTLWRGESVAARRWLGINVLLICIACWKALPLGIRPREWPCFLSLFPVKSRFS